MLCEIICVGNELLYGDTLNTNTQYLSQQLALLGVEVQYQLVVGDDEPKLLEAIEVASERVDIVIFSGGLGPTYDDMTKETLAKALGQALVLDEPSLEAIRSYFTSRGRVMESTNNKQAYRPSEGRCLPNGNGTAPGIYVEADGTHYFLLPGPPAELKPMFQDQLKPILQSLSSKVIESRTYRLTGIGESDLAKKIGHIMDHSDNPRIAPYVSAGAVNIRVTAMDVVAENVKAMLAKAHSELMPYIDPYVYSSDGKSIEEVVVQSLQKKGQTIATAESCTGGMVGSRIVNVSGASDVYMNGFITYSNAAKIKWLDVQASTLEAHGAVSEPVAIEMAQGVRKASGSDYGIGITGIAGPGGGTLEKPVGTVCIAVAWADGNDVRTYHFGGNRQKVRETSAQYGLVQLYKNIKNSG